MLLVLLAQAPIVIVQIYMIQAKSDSHPEQKKETREQPAEPLIPHAQSFPMILATHAHAQLKVIAIQLLNMEA
ncbi:MAG: hypothetical protein DM484_01880 [Candidatus Methylumidiphilus alinenensis]|uniref:Uncharacterized protein n=1 Tax=Candidatus Methylumidiphilus alinenensis TaxID=2202197 RepID=A0A2W4RM79_9GAMM|nr:MAG: hypothetical protein DM484_01880 [Candidatus Methylumidiphilus alinenensis]